MSEERQRFDLFSFEPLEDTEEDIELQKAKQDKEISKKELKKLEKKARYRRLLEKLQVFASIVGGIFFLITTIFNIRKQYTTSKFYPFLIASLCIYFAVFVILLIIRRKHVKQIKQDTEKFKSNMKLARIVCNLLFISTSALLFLQSLEFLDQRNFYVVMQTAMSGFLTLIKLSWTIFRLYRWFKKRKKIYRKA